jgi:hypothetical protein
MLAANGDDRRRGGEGDKDAAACFSGLKPSAASASSSDSCGSSGVVAVDAGPAAAAATSAVGVRESRQSAGASSPADGGLASHELARCLGRCWLPLLTLLTLAVGSRGRPGRTALRSHGV